MNKDISKLCLSTSIVLYLLSSTVSAADFNACSVEEVIIVGEKNAHVRLGCTVGPRPDCASAGNYIGFDKSTPSGQDYLKVVLTAFSSNSKLTGYVRKDRCSQQQGNVAEASHFRMTR